MNKRLVYSVLCICAILAILGTYLFLPSGRKPREEAQKSDAAAPSETPATNISNIPPKDLETMRKGLEAWGERMLKAGVKIVPPPLEQLQGAVASGDKGAILRAFHDVVYSRYKSSEVISALKEFLNDADPFVRYETAQSLLIVGDGSGYSTLLDLVQANEPIDGIGQDVRIQAAQTLGKFREKDATQAIYDLYQKTDAGGLIKALTTLEASQVRPLIGVNGFFAESSSIEYYVLNGTQKFIPQITSVFRESPKLEAKTTAAWALASMTGNQDATNYLIQQAQGILTNPDILDGTKEGGEKYAAGTKAIKYLGTIQTPEAKSTLEAALKSQDLSIVRVAVVNLIFNQGGSEKANQLVVQRLSGQESLLSIDLALSIAAQLDDPQIQAAGQVFDQRHAGGSWNLYTVERKDWPIYNWIDNYVVKLNE